MSKDEFEERSNVILLPLFPPSLPSLRPEPKKPIEDRESPPPHLLASATEAVLFASPEPMSLHKLNQCLGNPGKEVLYKILQELRKLYESQDRGVILMEVARGWQFRTDPRFACWIRPIQENDVPKLSKAALEALSIIAYQQPCTKHEVDQLRGVDSGAVIRVLLEFRLIEIVGRKKEIGTALIYGTSSEFLSLFNLRDLADLPRLRDLRELEESDLYPHL